MTQKKQIAKMTYSHATRMAQLGNQIAAHLGLPNNSLVNKAVVINYISNGVANIIVNGNWSKKQNFNLNLLK
jgi:ABC-type enterochelin transport system permease subunit